MMHSWSGQERYVRCVYFFTHLLLCTWSVVARINARSIEMTTETDLIFQLPALYHKSIRTGAIEGTRESSNTALPFPSRFWTAAPMTDRNLNPNSTTWLVSIQDLTDSGDDKLLNWTGLSGAAYTYPLTDTMSTVRILGGWSDSMIVSPDKENVSAPCCSRDVCHPLPACTPPGCCRELDTNLRKMIAASGNSNASYALGIPRMCCNPVEWSDIAYPVAAHDFHNSTKTRAQRVTTHAFNLRLEALFARLDHIVNNSILPVLVLDNVDYMFVDNATVGTYGQNMAPSNFSLYREFITEILTSMVSRYGHEATSKWWYRIGTEPNTRPGHWGDTNEHYNTMYDYVADAIVNVIGPNALIGPGNFCPFYEPGSGCNRSVRGGGLNASVQPIVEHLCHGQNAATGGRGSPVRFLGSSFYGSDGMEGCTRGEGCGYNPANAALAGQGLQYLQQLNASKLGGVPLEFMEYGTLTNAHMRVSPEPGAFGGAWTVASSIQAAANGVSRVFHWKAFEGIVVQSHGAATATQRRLYYSNAFVAAAARKIFVNVDQAEILLTEDNAPLATADANVTVPSPGNLSASAIAAWSHDASTFSVMASVFATHKNTTVQTTSKFHFSCSASAIGDGGMYAHERSTEDACTGNYTATGLYLTRERSPYDVILRDAQLNNWTVFDDGEVYGLRGLLNSAGLAALPQRAAKYLHLQSALYTPGPIPTNVVHVSCNAGACVLTLTATPPIVVAVQVNLTSRNRST